MEEDNDLTAYMNNSPFFAQRQDSWRHYTFKKDGVEAYLWFKFSLGGWRLGIIGEKDGRSVERGPIDSIKKLKKELGL